VHEKTRQSTEERQAKPRNVPVSGNTSTHSEISASRAAESPNRPTSKLENISVELVYDDEPINATMSISQALANAVHGTTMKLDNTVLGANADAFLDLENHTALAVGILTSETQQHKIDRIIHLFGKTMVGAFVNLPLVHILVLPAEPASLWKFLRPTPKEHSDVPRLLCYVYAKITKLSKLKEPVGQETGHVDEAVESNSDEASRLLAQVRNILPTEKEFFRCLDISLEKRVLALGYKHQDLDKKRLEAYMKSMGARVFFDYEEFRPRLKDARVSGVIVVHPSLGMVEVRNLHDINLALTQEFSFYLMGTDPRSGEYLCQSWFAGGTKIYLSRELYRDQPKDATSIINGLRYQNADTPMHARTWVLAMHPGTIELIRKWRADPRKTQEYGIVSLQLMLTLIDTFLWKNRFSSSTTLNRVGTAWLRNSCECRQTV
jgi:hypothetical protein